MLSFNLKYKIHFKGEKFNMKKYGISFILIIVILAGVVLFSVPDRIKYAFNGMAGYDSEDYEKRISKLPETELTIDFSTYNDEQIIIYQLKDGVYLALEDVEFCGEYYVLNFVSYGKSSFKKGDIICFNDNINTVYTNVNGEEYGFSIKVEDPLIDDKRNYSFYLGPQKADFNMEEFLKLKITIPIDKFELLSYERK